MPCSRSNDEYRFNSSPLHALGVPILNSCDMHVDANVNRAVTSNPVGRMSLSFVSLLIFFPFA
jgi:hypothetical protein